MELNSRQLSSLNEMGIPVWKLRSQVSNDVIVDTVIASQEPSEQLLRCTWVVMVDKNHHEQAQKLLHAMLSSIAVSPDQVSLISFEQLPQLQHIEGQGKVLLVLGEEISDPALSRGAIHQTQAISINTVLSFSLDELLAEPEKKAEAWHDLQLAQSALSQ